MDISRDTLEQAVRRAPGDVRSRQQLGNARLQEGDRAGAIAELQHVAGRFAAQGEPLKAMAICKAILAIDPENQLAPTVLAHLYAKNASHAPLPESMSAALEGEAPAHIEPDSLAIFRDALAGASGARSDPPPPSQKPLTQNLPRSPLFSSLDEGAFEELLRRMELRVARAGEELVREGEPGDSMFVVVQGVVNVTRHGKVVAVLGEGAFFGEMALLSSSPRLANVVAATDGVLFEVPRAQLEAIVAAHPGVGEVVEDFHRSRLLRNVMAASAIFRELDEKTRLELADRFTRQSVPPQTMLLTQGQPGFGLHLLLRGRCEVFHSVAAGGELPLPSLREGDVFGEISALTGAPCTASVRALSYCEILTLSRKDLNELVVNNAKVRVLMQELMNRRLQHTADLLDLRSTVLTGYVV